MASDASLTACQHQFDEYFPRDDIYPFVIAPADSIRPVEQSPRNHLRLDFRRAREDREDADIAQDARDRIFARETVAAVAPVGGGSSR